jgi:hypothetical protein
MFKRNVSTIMAPLTLSATPTCAWEDMAVPQVAKRWPEPDAGGDDIAQFIRASLSQYPEIGANHCEFGEV